MRLPRHGLPADRRGTGDAPEDLELVGRQPLAHDGHQDRPPGRPALAVKDRPQQFRVLDCLAERDDWLPAAEARTWSQCIVAASPAATPAWLAGDGWSAPPCSPLGCGRSATWDGPPIDRRPFPVPARSAAICATSRSRRACLTARDSPPAGFCVRHVEPASVGPNVYTPGAVTLAFKRFQWLGGKCNIRKYNVAYRKRP